MILLHFDAIWHWWTELVGIDLQASQSLVSLSFLTLLNAPAWSIGRENYQDFRIFLSTKKVQRTLCSFRRYVSCYSQIPYLKGYHRRFFLATDQWAKQTATYCGHFLLGYRRRRPDRSYPTNRSIDPSAVFGRGRCMERTASVHKLAVATSTTPSRPLNGRYERSRTLLGTTVGLCTDVWYRTF